VGLSILNGINPLKIQGFMGKGIKPVHPNDTLPDTLAPKHYDYKVYSQIQGYHSEENDTLPYLLNSHLCGLPPPLYIMKPSL
jgi:hypothetical protein